MKSSFFPVKIYVEGDGKLPSCMANSREEAIQKIRHIYEKGQRVTSVLANCYDYCGRVIELLDDFGIVAN